jgi:outer membrane receptor for ferrienterochelin and colicin
MPGYRSPVAMAVALALPAAITFTDVYAQAVAHTTDDRDQVVITGTRVQNRSVLETAVPVDVLTSDVFQNRGVPEISQALSDSLPSYNFPRPGLSDATDTVRPATLRGLSPDETLVLVNGKRRQLMSSCMPRRSLTWRAGAPSPTTCKRPLARRICWIRIPTPIRRRSTRLGRLHFPTTRRSDAPGDSYTAA